MSSSSSTIPWAIGAPRRMHSVEQSSCAPARYGPTDAPAPRSPETAALPPCPSRTSAPPRAFRRSTRRLPPSACRAFHPHRGPRFQPPTCDHVVPRVDEGRIQLPFVPGLQTCPGPHPACGMLSQAIQATVFAAVRERIRFADHDLGMTHCEEGFQVAFIDPPEEAADGLDVFLRHHSSIPFSPCSATSNLLDASGCIRRTSTTVIEQRTFLCRASPARIAGAGSGPEPP